MDSEQDVARAATDLARYALACHAAGKQIKREDLRESVMSGLKARSFKTVLDAASRRLEETFGLRLVALPAHERQLADVSGNDTQQSKPVARWVLQSALSDAARERLEPVQGDTDAATLGFAAAVLSLVFVNNMSIANDQLVLYVRRLGPPKCVLPPSEAHGDGMASYTTDAQLESAAQAAIGYLVKQRFLDKLSAHGAAGARQGISDTQASQAPDAGEPDAGMEYTWGPQAKVMFEPLDMARFIAAMAGADCTPDFVKTIGRACGRNINAAEPA